MEEELEALFKEEYQQILQLARSRLARERAPISTTTLAHELYLDLQHRADLKFTTKQHFLAYASRAMRSLLVDMARERIAQKRSAELMPLTAGDHVSDAGGTPEELVALDEALQRLGSLDERLLRVAEMRMILGMEVPDIAIALGVSEPTIVRDWRRAKIFLHEALGTVRE
jgi:RNA polymerase sigma factor (TIGR02999 family)